MDYGQSVANSNQNQYQEPFFTAGVGRAPENVNPDSNNSLNVGIYSSPDEPAVSDQPSQHEATRAIGSSAILSSGQETHQEYPSNTIDSLAWSTNPGQLGEVVSLEMPPDAHTEMPQEESVGAEPAETRSSAVEIKTTNTLNESGIKKVDNILNRLSQDGNAAAFYAAAREMMEVNLSNSYGANAAWKGNKAA